MSSITQVSDTMQTILTSRAKALERASGFVERSSAQLDGPIFSQTTVLTWMHTAEASYSQLRHTAASLGVQVSTQAIEQRFSEASVRLLRALLEEAVGQVISSEAKAPQVLARFNGVYLQDGTVISLPASLAHEWPGRGQAGQEAAMRVQAQLELGAGSLSGLWLQGSREAERSGEAISTPLPVGSLFNADMGYFTLQEMRQRGKLGQYWLTQARVHADLQRSLRPLLGPALLLTCADERTGGCGPVRGQAGALTRAAARRARLARGSQAATRGGQWAHHASAQRLSSSHARQAQAQRAAAGQTQGQEDQCGSSALSRLDDSADQRAKGAALCAGSPRAAAVPLANRTAVETVETAWQARYLAQLQAGAHSDGTLCQTARAGDHTLAGADRLLAST